MTAVKRVIFITGTDTGVGKTVLTFLLTRQFAAEAMPFAALKPLCSGGREDAEVLHELQKGRLSLDEINPWHFRPPVSPLIAARRAGKRIALDDTVRHVQGIQKRFPIVIVEGAGGLLSPMGEDFDSRDLILALRATPVVVCTNRLGVVNQLRLVLEALPEPARRSCPLVCMAPETPDASTRDNLGLLREHVSAERIFSVPRLDWQHGRISATAASAVKALSRNLFRRFKL